MADITDEQCAETQKTIANLICSHAPEGESCSDCLKLPYAVVAGERMRAWFQSKGWEQMTERAGIILPCEEHVRKAPRTWILDIKPERFAAWLRSKSGPWGFSYREDELRALLDG